MRVIAGQYRGRPLKTLKGDLTRPTTDRVKEALMSSVVSHHGSFEGTRVLDAFAGSGSLGIEALSRGASFVLFADQARQAQSVIAANLGTLGVDSAQWHLYRGDTFKMPHALYQDPFDMVFLDPPYAYECEQILTFVDDLDQARLLVENVLIIYEFARSNREQVLHSFETHHYAILSAKDYGDTSVVLARKESE